MIEPQLKKLAVAAVVAFAVYCASGDEAAQAASVTTGGVSAVQTATSVVEVRRRFRRRRGYGFRRRFRAPGAPTEAASGTAPAKSEETVPSPRAADVPRRTASADPKLPPVPPVPAPAAAATPPSAQPGRQSNVAPLPRAPAVPAKPLPPPVAALAPPISPPASVPSYLPPSYRPGEEPGKKPAPAVPATWSEAEVVQGLSECLTEMSGKKVVFDALKPIKEGECGSPAPILLKAFQSDKDPSVTIVPAATTSCKMAAGLRRWLDGVVQPAARLHLGTTIVRLSNASGYDCRSRSNEGKVIVSQHALANALDVGAFVTAKGETVSVLDHWEGGGQKTEFLRDVHNGACTIFGTTLGPEANADHKNHFHLDMIPRRSGNLCDFTPGQVSDRRNAERDKEVKLRRKLDVRRLQFSFLKPQRLKPVLVRSRLGQR